MREFVLCTLFIGLIVFGAIFSHCSSPKETTIVDSIPIRNTITIRDTVYIDSTHQIVDSLEEELFVAKYKLERIKYYNDIAKKGNNIKYLRGWINRVINNN